MRGALEACQQKERSIHAMKCEAGQPWYYSHTVSGWCLEGGQPPGGGAVFSSRQAHYIHAASGQVQCQMSQRWVSTPLLATKGNCQLHSLIGWQEGEGILGHFSYDKIYHSHQLRHGTSV